MKEKHREETALNDIEEHSEGQIEARKTRVSGRKCQRHRAEKCQQRLKIPDSGLAGQYGAQCPA